MTSDAGSPFHDLRSALNLQVPPESGEALCSSDPVRVDRTRWQRTGIPEVVHAERKEIEDVVTGLRRLALAQGRALASRVPSGAIEPITAALQREFGVEVHQRARCIVAHQPDVARPRRDGRVGILSAGTSDIPIASEAALMAAEMGATVLEGWDVGVAGLHRLVEPLERFVAHGVEVIIVAAGMDGALPSVVAGLVDVPVIGLPTSIGYGFGGGGVGALTTMLQSCAPGLVVVNIDNGIGAGATAALIANRVGASRPGQRIDPGSNGGNGALR